MKTKRFSIFDWLKEITLKKSEWSSFTEDQKDEFNSYMINRFLSQNSNYIDIVNIVQRIPYTEKEKIYNVYKSLIPKQNVFLKYVKSSTPTYPQKLLEYLASYIKCSQVEASEYIPLLGKDNVKNALISLNVDKKEITKLTQKIK
jgi:hypothetical protein